MVGQHFNNKRTWIEIDKTILKGNIDLLKTKLNPGVRFAAVVKANAYGHGLIASSRALLENGAEFLAVAYIEEALELRKNDILAPILMLSQPLVQDIPLIISQYITPAVYSYDFAEKLSFAAVNKNKIISVHIKIETGLNRLGVNLNEASRVIEDISKLPGIKIDGIYTHFSNAFSDNLDFTRKQFQDFDLLIAQIKKKGISPRYIHAANSAAFVWFSKSQYNLVRFGLAMYGLQPSSEKKYPLDVKQIFTWKTKILQIKEISKGERVGYGESYCVLRKTKIATIAVGYADGFRRSPSNFKYVLCNGNRAEIIGNVTMSQSMIDISNIPGVALDSEIVIIGKQKNAEISFEEIAERTGTINEEIATSISPKIPRINVES